MIKIGVALVLIVVGIFAINSCVEYLDASHVMVIQYPTGTLKVATEPGPYPQWFGTVTKYPRRETFDFSNSDKCIRQNKDGSPPLKVQFNDGGFAFICGSLQWEIPVQPEMLIRIQKEYGSHRAVDQQLVTKVMENAIYFSGPVMSSIESAGERRPELLQYIDDQARNGVYQVQTHTEKRVDPITKQERTYNTVEIIRDKDGKPLRNASSAVNEYKIKIVQLAVSEISYDDVVKQQIKTRQDSINAVQLSIATATKAEQDTKTTIEQGKAAAAKSQWDQEAIKAKEVTRAIQEKEVAETGAQKEREVAKLQRDAAEFTKQRDILLGQGESEKRRLILAADGALEKKLEAFVTINGQYAKALSDYKGDWVPNVVMGDSAGGKNQGLALIDLLTAKTARDLGLDVSVPKK